VAVVVSELVTNAVRHTTAPIHLTVQTSVDGVRLEVSDLAPRLPGPPVLDPQAEGGRGLAIVAGLADAWGIDPIAGDGKIVWAELRWHHAEPRDDMPN
jgi:anti-sigma regulatory factor (Ser/Thr protein kinase)